MTAPQTAFFGPEMNLSALTRAAWASADKMCWALAEVGIDYSVTSCKRLRSGQTEPRYTLGHAIAALADAKLEQDIADRRAIQAKRKTRRRHV